MTLSRWMGRGGPRGTGPAPRGRVARGLKPESEPLGGRRLLSTVAAPAVLPVPSAAAVANAVAVLEAHDPSTFARLRADLAKAEGHSRVRTAQATRLAQDEAALDQAILTIGHDRSTPSQLMMNVQYVNDQVDTAFFGDMVPVSQEFIGAFREAANRPETWGQLQRDLSRLSISPGVVQHTAHQMQVVARAVHLSPRLKRAFWDEYNTLNLTLGQNPDMNLGPGAEHLDAVQVYFHAQVNNFIRS